MGSVRWWTFITAVVLFGFAVAQCSTSPGTVVTEKPVSSGGAIDLCGDDGGTCCDAGSCCDGGACCDAQSLEIISPDEDGVVSTSEAALILANLLPQRMHRGEEQVQIYAIRASDGSRLDIAQGDLRLLGGPDADIAARWVLDGVSPGRYTIYVVVTLIGCPQLTASVDVLVNQAPEIDELVALSCDLRDDGIHVVVRAVASDPDGDGIVPDSYEWYAGDDSAPEFGTYTYQHTYSAGLTEAEVAVSVFDYLGGSALSAHRLDLIACAFLDDDDHANDCGCDDMAIESQYHENLTTGIYCADNARQIPPGCRQINIRNGCPPGKVQFDCKTGPMSPGGPIRVAKLGWNFQVEAHIDKNTRNVDKCRSGQIARGTTRFTPIGGREVVDPPPNAQTTPTPRHPHPDDADFRFEIVNGPRDKVPAFDEGSNPPKFGGDNYIEEWLFLRHHTNNLWFWFDNPGITIDLGPRGDQNVKQQAQFVSWVTGNLGSCWCRTEIQQEWDRTNGRTAIGGGAAPNVMTKISGKNCRVRSD